MYGVLWNVQASLSLKLLRHIDSFLAQADVLSLPVVPKGSKDQRIPSASRCTLTTSSSK